MLNKSNVIFNRDTIKYLNKIFKKNNFKYKSSHVSESIANGFGFKTNSSLLSNINFSSKNKVSEFNCYNAGARLSKLSKIPLDETINDINHIINISGIKIINDNFDTLKNKPDNSEFYKYINSFFLFLWRESLVDVHLNFIHNIDYDPLNYILNISNNKYYLDNTISYFIINYINRLLKNNNNLDYEDFLWADIIFYVFKSEIRCFFDNICMTSSNYTINNINSFDVYISKNNNLDYNIESYINSKNFKYSDNKNIIGIIAMFLLCSKHSIEYINSYIKSLLKITNIDDLYNEISLYISKDLFNKVVCNNSEVELYKYYINNNKIFFNNDINHINNIIKSLKDNNINILYEYNFTDYTSLFNFILRSDFYDGVFINLSSITSLDKESISLIKNILNYGIFVLVYYDDISTEIVKLFE